MFLKGGFIPIMGNGVEIQINDVPIVQSQTDRFLHKGLLELQEVNLVEGIGIVDMAVHLGRTFRPVNRPKPGSKA